jgi:lipoprotein-anchoring transpeptidase ErfK/SrfK
MNMKSLIVAMSVLVASSAFAQKTVPNPVAPATTAAPATSPSAPEKTAVLKKSSKADTAQSAAAPGGGAGKVWVNTSSKVYHCEGDKYYGKTKKGEYMAEADAKTKGFHGEHGKSCAAKS